MGGFRQPPELLRFFIIRHLIQCELVLGVEGDRVSGLAAVNGSTCSSYS